MHLNLYTPLVEPIISYMRMLRFTGPEQVKRYYRLFGDLEYDLLSLRAENTVMQIRLREVKRRVLSSVILRDEEERQINVDSHDLAEHLFDRVEGLQRSIASSRGFRFDSTREQQSYYLLADIAYAIMGIEDRAVRARERETLGIACGAYSRLDLSALIDIHDSVQTFLAVQRRERLDDIEETEWRQKLENLRRTHPLCCVKWLDDPSTITRRMSSLKRQINVRQGELEKITFVYQSIVNVMRERN